MYTRENGDGKTVVNTRETGYLYRAMVPKFSEIYKLPTDKQIMYGWNVKPTARNVALIIRDFADEKMENFNEKAYAHMSDDDKPAYAKRISAQAKVTISIRKLAQFTGASEEGIKTALAELQKKGFIEKDQNSYRLMPGKSTSYKDSSH